MMDTVLFTDFGILVFTLTTSAIALMLAVLGLATTEQTRSDIKHLTFGGRGRRTPSNVSLLFVIAREERS